MAARMGSAETRKSASIRTTNVLVPAMARACAPRNGVQVVSPPEFDPSLRALTSALREFLFTMGARNRRACFCCAKARAPIALPPYPRIYPLLISSSLQRFLFPAFADFSTGLSSSTSSTLGSIFAKNAPVYDSFTVATFSGVPSAITRPPRAPPSGPKSNT